MKINGIEYGDNVSLEVKKDSELPKTDIEILNQSNKISFGVKESLVGGGSSDFSVANITVINPDVSPHAIELPVILEAGTLNPEQPAVLLIGPVACEPGETAFKVPLYKGLCAHQFENSYIASTTGGVQYDDDDQIMYITGDGTITLIS